MLAVICFVLEALIAGAHMPHLRGEQVWLRLKSTEKLSVQRRNSLVTQMCLSTDSCRFNSLALPPS